MGLLGRELFVFSNGNVFALLFSGHCYCFNIILPSSFLRNLKRSGTKSVGSGGDGNQGWIQHREYKPWSCWNGVVSVLKIKEAGGVGE